jgi:hypothetical protein
MDWGTNILSLRQLQPRMDLYPGLYLRNTKLVIAMHSILAKESSTVPIDLSF